MDRRGAFDYILLETTGLADPGNIAPVFWVDDGLGSSIYLDGIVTVVDAKNILRELDQPASGERADTPALGGEGHQHRGPVLSVAHLQISHADVILLNKTDLVSAPRLAAIQARLESINALARITRTTHARVPTPPGLSGTVLDLHAYDAQTTLPPFAARGHSHLDPGISTLSLPLPVFEEQKLFMLEQWLQAMLWDDDDDGPSANPRRGTKPYEIHRLKGLVVVADGPARIVQGVREVFDVVEVAAPAARQTAQNGQAEREDQDDGSPEQQGRIVLIGRGLENVKLDLGGLE